MNVNKYSSQPVGKAKKSLNKQDSMDAYLQKQMSEVEAISTYLPSVATLTNNDYRGKKPRMLMSAKIKAGKIDSLVTSNLAKHTTPTKGLVPTTTVPDLYDLEAHMANITYMSYFVADRLFFINPLAYDPTYEFADSDYTSAMDDLVAEIASAPRDKWSPFDRKIAKNAVAILNSVRAQSNSHNPFYAMPVSLIFDRLKDYFIAVNRTSVLIANAKILISKEFMLGVQGGAHRYNEAYGYKYYSDPSNLNKIQEAIAQAVTAINGSYCVKEVLEDYLMYGTVSLMPNQNHAFRFLVPIQYDQTGGTSSYIYNGRSLFDLNTTKTEANIASNVDDLVTALESAAAYFKGGSAQIINAGLQGYNQFNTLRLSMASPALAVHVPVLLSLENQKIRFAGHYVQDVATTIPFNGVCFSIAPDVVNYDDPVAGITAFRAFLAQPGGLGRLSLMSTGLGVTNGAIREIAKFNYVSSLTEPSFKARVAASLQSNIEYKKELDSTGGHTLMYYNSFAKNFGLTRLVASARAIPVPGNSGAFSGPDTAGIAARGVTIDTVPTVASNDTQIFAMGDASLIREIDVIFLKPTFYEAHLNSDGYSFIDAIASTDNPFVGLLTLSEGGSEFIAGYSSRIARKIEQSLGVPVLTAGMTAGGTTYSGADINITATGMDVYLDFDDHNLNMNQHLFDLIPGIQSQADKSFDFDYPNFQFATKLAYSGKID